MHFKKLRDMLSWKISDKSLTYLIFTNIQTNHFFFGSFGELKMHQLC